MVLLCLCAAACHTARPRQGEETLSASPAADRQARALAQYSQALIEEKAGHPAAAASNLVAAARLDASSEELRLRAAMALMQLKRFADAQQLLTEWCAAHPESEKGMLWLALAYRAADDGERALQTYRRIIARVPASPIAYIESASLLAKAQQEGKALAILEEGAAAATNATELLTAASELLTRCAAADRLTDELRSHIPALIKRAEQAVADRPEEPWPTFALADLLVANQTSDRAVEVLEKFAAQHPDDPQVMQKLAVVFAGLGDKKRALTTLEGMARRNPDSGRLHYVIGELYEQLEEPAEARAAFEAATKARRPEPTAFLKLAMMMVDDDPAAAIAELRRGQEKLPKDQRITEMLAYLLLAEQRAGEAIPEFERARRLQAASGGASTTPAFVLSHILALQLAHRPDDALKMLLGVAEENEAYLEGYARLVLRTDEATNAVETAHLFDRVAAARTNSITPLAMQGLLYSAAEDFTNALACFAQAEERMAKEKDRARQPDAAFHFWYGSAAERAGDIELAARQFERCLAMDETHAEAMNYLAYMWAEKGIRLADALKWSLKSLELEPESPAFLDTLGWVYFRQGDLELALKQIQKAANLMPEDPTIVLHLGDIMDKMGKADRAVVYWERSFVLDPDNRDLAGRLEKLGRDLAPLRARAEKHRAEAEKAARQRSREDVDSPADP